MSTKKHQNKHPHAIDRADREAGKALQPLIAYAQSHKGTVTLIAERLTRLNKSKVHRQLVEKWLDPDPAFRTQPRHGIGILLQQIWGEIQAAESTAVHSAAAHEHPGTPKP